MHSIVLGSEYTEYEFTSHDHSLQEVCYYQHLPKTTQRPYLEYRARTRFADRRVTRLDKGHWCSITQAGTMMSR